MQVVLDGVYMGSEIRTTNFEGNERSFVTIDVYNPAFNGNNKTAVVRADDLAIANTLNKDFQLGVPFKAKINISAYKNNVYYKLVEILK